MTQAKFHSDIDRLPWWVWLLLGVGGVLIGFGLALTPAGLAGKLQVLAYAVCHQNPGHTLAVSGRLLPLCARCTGMYLGSLVAMISLRGEQQSSASPRKGLGGGLAVLALFFVVDSLNSAFFHKTLLYPPNNLLRLFSGLAMGVVIACLLLPVWRQLLRAGEEKEAMLHSWGQFLILLVAAALTGLLVLLAPAWMFYPIAILSVGMVPILLTMVYALLWIMILKKEGSVRNLKGRITYITLGVFTATVQLAGFIWFRFFLTGTWAGIQF